MTTSLEKTRPAALAHPGDLTEDQVDLVKRTVCKGERPLTDDELAMYVARCEQHGCHPLSGQLYVFPQAGGLVFGVRIDGFRSRAMGSGQYAGTLPIQWCGEDGEWSNVWLKKFAPIAARARVLRKDCKHPFEFVAHWKEFGKDGGIWDRMPRHMLGIRAESHALRMAFPEQLAGLYTPEDFAGEDIRPDLSPPVEVLPAPSQSAPAGITQTRGEMGNVPPQPPAVPGKPRTHCAKCGMVLTTPEVQRGGVCRSCERKPPAAPSTPPRSELADNYEEGPPPPEAAQSNFEKMIAYAVHAGIPDAATYVGRISPKTKGGAVKARWSQAERDAAVAAIDELAADLTAAAQPPDDIPPDFGAPEPPKPAEQVDVVTCREMTQKISRSLEMGFGAVERRAQEYLGDLYQPDAKIPRDLAERFWSVVRAENKGEAQRG